MNTLIIILSIAIVLSAAVLFALAKYREYLFKKKPTPDLMDVLRRSRKTFFRLTNEQRESAYGRMLLKSIRAIELELKQRANA